MWKAIWQTWTVDKPALLGDWLWDIFVVRLAAYLDRLTVRQIIAFIPAVILFIAYYHSIPLHPGLMLLGDLLAYIDLFAMLFLLGILGRVATIAFIAKQVIARATRLASRIMIQARWLDARHRRERGAKGRRRLTGWASKEEEPGVVGGVAWA
ncbi:MAG: hypothetical protein WDO17_19130 [Alphaproteobacteria bacterium]